MLSIINVGSPSVSRLVSMTWSFELFTLTTSEVGGRNIHPFIRFCSDAGTETFSIIIGVYVTDDWPGSMGAFYFTSKGLRKDIEKRGLRMPGTQTHSCDSLVRGHCRAATSQPPSGK